MTQQALFALPAYHRGSYCTCASERLGAERPPWDAIVSSAERCVPASRLWRSPDSRSWHFPRRRRRLPGDVPAQAGGAQGDTGRKAAIHVRGVIRRAPSAPCARPGRRRRPRAWRTYARGRRRPGQPAQLLRQPGRARATCLPGAGAGGRSGEAGWAGLGAGTKQAWPGPAARLLLHSIARLDASHMLNHADPGAGRCLLLGPGAARDRPRPVRPEHPLLAGLRAPLCGRCR